MFWSPAINPGWHAQVKPLNGKKMGAVRAAPAVRFRARSRGSRLQQQQDKGPAKNSYWLAMTVSVLPVVFSLNTVSEILLFN
jgi:hypothetical protein